MTKRDELRKLRAHGRVWRRLSREVDQILGTLGQAGRYDDDADYWIVGNDWDCDAVQVDLRSLCLLRLDVIDKLQAALRDDPDWRITISISVRDPSARAPAMLTIYSDEIIDELKRENLPEQFRDVVFGMLGADIKKDIAERVRSLMNKSPT